jgi:hypothetical protein
MQSMLKPLQTALIVSCTTNQTRYHENLLQIVWGQVNCTTNQTRKLHNQLLATKPVSMTNLLPIVWGQVIMIATGQKMCASGLPPA